MAGHVCPDCQVGGIMKNQKAVLVGPSAPEIPARAIPLASKCSTCKGTKVVGDPGVCESCNGSGDHWVFAGASQEQTNTFGDCPNCGGSGKLQSSRQKSSGA